MKPSFFVRRALKESAAQRQRARVPGEVTWQGNGAPEPLNRASLRRLLEDRGRQTLHALVAESVEQAAHWRQVWAHLRQAGQEQAALEAHINSLKWRHQLRILEMICDAQWFLDGP